MISSDQIHQENTNAELISVNIIIKKNIDFSYYPWISTALSVLFKENLWNKTHVEPSQEQKL